MRLHEYNFSQFHKNPVSGELICSWKLPGLCLSKSWVAFCLLSFFLWQRWQKRKSVPWSYNDLHTKNAL